MSFILILVILAIIGYYVYKKYYTTESFGNLYQDPNESYLQLSVNEYGNIYPNITIGNNIAHKSFHNVLPAFGDTDYSIYLNSPEIKKELEHIKKNVSNIYSGIESDNENLTGFNISASNNYYKPTQFGLVRLAKDVTNKSPIPKPNEYIFIK